MPLLGAQTGIEPAREAGGLGRPEIAARQCCPDLLYRTPRLLRRADGRDAKADPLGRVLRRDRRQELAQEPPQQPRLPAEQRLAGLRVFPKGLRRHRAPLRIGDAARSTPGIAGLARGEPAGLVAGLIQGLIADGESQKIRSKQLILLDFASEMQRKAARSRRIGNHFRNLANLARGVAAPCVWIYVLVLFTSRVCRLKILGHSGFRWAPSREREEKIRDGAARRAIVAGGR